MLRNGAGRSILTMMPIRRELLELHRASQAVSAARLGLGIDETPSELLDEFMLQRLRSLGYLQ